MVTKVCVICGKVFDAVGSSVTCGEKCSKKRKKLYDSKYGIYYNRDYSREHNHEYYLANSEKWKWYRENMSFFPVGTSNLVERVHKDDEGVIDFVEEANLIIYELKRLGLRPN